jgi:hypothetical protein
MIKKLVKNIYKNSKTARYYWMIYSWYKANRNMKLSDEEFAQQDFYKSCGKLLNLDNPQTYDEKLWWLKLNNRDPLLTKCSDKYLVREYVQECGLSHILNKLYGVYEDAREIDFSNFNQPTFLKCNHTSGYNIIYYPNKKFDRKDFINRFNFALKQNYYVQSREWNYKNIEPKIIAEEVLYNEDGSLPVDYKFLCFNGEPKLLYMMFGTSNEKGEHASKENRYMNIYDMDFNLTNITQGFNIFKEKKVEKPKLFEEMKRYAKILSSPFECCRVDFYLVKGKIFFGEITFYDGGGCNNTQPTEWDLLIGSWINLNQVIERKELKEKRI